MCGILAISREIEDIEIEFLPNSILLNKII